MSVGQSLGTFVAGVVFGLCCLCSSTVLAQTTWTWSATGVPGSSWDTSGQWTTPGAPAFNSSSNSDNLVFDSSTNTAVNLVNANQEDAVQSITFNAGAPAYTFSRPSFPAEDIWLTGASAPSLTNNSSHVQTISAGLSMSGATINANNGDAGSHLAFEIGDHLWTSGTTTFNGPFNVDLSGYLTGSGTMVANTNINVVGPWTPSNGNLTKMGSGTLTLNTASSTSGRTLNLGNTTGTLSNDGAVRLADGAAAGTLGIKINGNVFTNAALELTNNINVTTPITIQARQDNLDSSNNFILNADATAIRNVSGNNSISGPFTIQSGGDRFNFESLAGNLTFLSNFQMSLSSTRVASFTGAGNFDIAPGVSFTNTNTMLALYKTGSGTLTIDGTFDIHPQSGRPDDAVINGGKLVVSSTGTLAGVATYSLGNGATLDYSAVAGGLSIDNQTLQGTGTVLGNVTTTANTTLIAGNSEIYYRGTSSSDPSGLKTVVSTGHMTIANDLALNGNFIWHLGALSTSNPGTDYDLLNVNGALTIGASSKLSIDLSLLGSQQPGNGDPFWNTSHTWTIISTSNNVGSANFTTIQGGNVATGTFTTSIDPGAILGDVNGDHVVNGLDIAVVASHWLLTGATLGQGDANGDGTVNGLDIALIASHWLSIGGGSGGSIILTYTPSAGGGTAVPEPSSFVLAGLSAIGIVYARRRRPA